jgi:hypothetical protein
VIRCRTCVMPNTRPDTPFIDGECSACVSYRKRSSIDWAAREKELLAILDRHGGRCIVPSSGGKDSHWQVLKLLELGADVTVVTARTCHLTPIGRANIDNLARYARTIEVVPNMTVRAKLNRLALEMVGDISWPEHCAIFTTPFKMAGAQHPAAVLRRVPAGSLRRAAGQRREPQMTARWRSEFGGFLGLRPSDFIGMEGITELDMADYMPPDEVWPIEAYFLGQFYEWDSHRNATVAAGHGMRSWAAHRHGDATYYAPPAPGNLWTFENLDNAQTGLHDYFMWLKFGFGRGCQQISVDVRAGRIPRSDALAWVGLHYGALQHYPYAGVSLDEVLAGIGMSRDQLDGCIDRFTDTSTRVGAREGVVPC